MRISDWSSDVCSSDLKSTLFNNVTQSDVYAADQLFATLDPTLRRLDLDDLGPIVLADTVGFIRHLPHKLVEAFRATLEESSNSSAERRVGQECVRTGRSRWSPAHYKKKSKKQR